MSSVLETLPDSIYSLRLPVLTSCTLHLKPSLATRLLQRSMTEAYLHLFTTGLKNEQNHLEGESGLTKRKADRIEFMR